MTTPKPNLREEISKLPIIDPYDSTVGEVIGKENLDKIMQKFTQALERGRIFIPIETKDTFLALERLDFRGSMREISEITGSPITTIAYHIDKLKGAGIIEKIGPRKYQLRQSERSENG